MRDHSLYFSDACSSPPAKLSDQWRKTMTSRTRYFVLIALAPLIIGLAGFDSSVEARHRHRYDGCCPAPCPVACPAPCPVACPAPCPVACPAPVISCPAPAPVIKRVTTTYMCCPTECPKVEEPAPAPVIEEKKEVAPPPPPPPAPVIETPPPPPPPPAPRPRVVKS